MFWVRQLLYRKGHESLTAKYVPIKYLSCWCLQTPKQKNINFSCLNDDYIEHVHLKHQNSGFLLWINQILLFQMKLFWHNLKWILSIGFPYRNQTYKVHYQWHNETIWIGHKIPQAKQRQPYVIPVCAVRGWSCCCCCCYLYTAFGAFGIRGCYEFSLKKKFPLRLIGVYLSWYVQSASSAHRVQQTLFAIDLV